MKKNLTDMIFILDKSGSMSGLESDTIGGFNSMIEKQRKEDGEANVTTVLFDNRIDIIHDRFDIKDVKAMTDRDYFVGGSTALLDAIGSSIRKEINVQRHLPEESQAEKVIFVIITDGYENSSKAYSYRQIKKMIEHEQEKYGWEFIFMGANIDAVAEGGRLGISAQRSVTYCADEIGTGLNFCVVGETLSKMREGTISKDDASWKSAIEEDYKRRG